ncbi:hypothetical protein H5410_049455, partial [Solanum commersonii]
RAQNSESIRVIKNSRQNKQNAESERVGAAIFKKSADREREKALVELGFSQKSVNIEEENM